MNAIEILRDTAKQSDIVEHIGRYVTLKKVGKNYRGLCPFHDEKTPSFYVSPHGFFNCFGCGEKGDIITFESKYNKRDFVNSLESITGEKAVSTTFKVPQKKKLKDVDLLDKLYETDPILVECLSEHCLNNEVNLFDYILSYQDYDSSISRLKKLINDLRL
ncbi:CHC2 zinc finger domain-containing protein [Ekhidna sp.]|uniref:CHC2 zinc finger domain-containing protein n=1 Tax=Ekhidna sp. TaxID=2608089 RepID=UPI003BAAE3FD